MAEVRVTAEELPTFVVGEAYYFQFRATGGSEPYEFFLVSGTLPRGLTLTPAGVLSGTALECVGPYQFTVGARSAKVLDIESGIEVLDLGLRGESQSYKGDGTDSGTPAAPDKTFARSEFLFDPNRYSVGTSFFFEAEVSNRSFTESRKITIVKQNRGRSEPPLVVHTLAIPPQVEKRRIRFSNAFMGFESESLPTIIDGPSTTGAPVSREDAYRVRMEKGPAYVKTYPTGAIFPSATFELHKLRLLAFSPRSNKHTVEFPLTSFYGDTSALDETATASGCTTSSTSYVNIPGAAIFRFLSAEWGTLIGLDLMATLKTSASPGIATVGLHDFATNALVATVALTSAEDGIGPITVSEPMSVSGTLIDGHDYIIKLKSSSGKTASLYKSRLRLTVSPINRMNTYTRYAVGEDNRESRFLHTLLLDETDPTLLGSGCGDETVIAGVRSVLLDGTGTNASVALVDAGVEERRVTISNTGTLTFAPDGGKGTYPGWFGYTSGDHVPAQNWTVDKNFAPITDYIANRKQNSLQNIDDVRTAEWAAALAAWQFELLATYLNTAAALAGKSDINTLRDGIIASLESDLPITADNVIGSTLTFGATKSLQRTEIQLADLTPGNIYFGSMSSSGLVQALLVLQLDVTEIETTETVDISPGTVLMRRVYKAPKDLEWTFDNTVTRIRRLCFEAYFFNLMWEYSQKLELQAYLAPPPVPILQVVSVTSSIITIRTDLVATDDTKSVLVELSPSHDFQGYIVCIKGGPLQSVYALQVPTGPISGIAFIDGWYVRAKRQDYLGASSYSDVLFIPQSDIDSL